MPKAGHKKVVLELGGNAAAIVDADQGDRLDHVIDRLIFGSYYQSGQSCIGVQRIYAHADVYDALNRRLVAATKKLKAGDRLLLAAFGGGFTWGGIYLTWAYDGRPSRREGGAAEGQRQGGGKRLAARLANIVKAPLALFV